MFRNNDYLHIMKISGIYKIQSVIKPERCYIGSSTNLRNRKYDHRYLLKKGIHHSAKLQAHYNKYGAEDLIYSIVYYCDKSDLIPDENGVIQLEQFYIDSFHSWFNMCPKAHSHAGLKYSQEVCDKMGAMHKGQKAWNKGLKATPEARLNQSIAHKGKQAGENNPFYGKKHKLETIQHFKEERRGKNKPPFTEEHRKNIGKTKKGNTYRKGMITTEATRKKQSEAAIKRYESKDERLKTSLSLIGNKNRLRKTG
jgi:group I intron endonuclease